MAGVILYIDPEKGGKCILLVALNNLNSFHLDYVPYLIASVFDRLLVCGSGTSRPLPQESK